MFKESLFSSKFREEMARHLNDLKDFEVIQLLQRDSSVKVIITQETYFDLLSKSKRLYELLNGFDEETSVEEHVSADNLKERVRKKASRLNQQEDTANGHHVGKRRSS